MERQDRSPDATDGNAAAARMGPKARAAFETLAVEYGFEAWPYYRPRPADARLVDLTELLNLGYWGSRAHGEAEFRWAADRYWATPGNAHLVAAARRIVPDPGPALSVVELGCGPVGAGPVIGKAGVAPAVDYIGMDADPGTVAYAQATVPGARYFTGSAEDFAGLSLPRRADLFVFRKVLMCLGPPRLADVIAVSARLARFVYIEDFAANFDGEALGVVRFPYERFDLPMFAHPLVGLMREAGFALDGPVEIVQRHEDARAQGDVAFAGALFRHGRA